MSYIMHHLLEGETGVRRCTNPVPFGPNLRTHTLVIGMPSQSINELSSHFTPGRLESVQLFIIVDAAIFFY